MGDPGGDLSSPPYVKMKMAESPNHTAIYLPIGEAGVPLVKSVE